MKKKFLSISLTFTLILTILGFTTMFNASARPVESFGMKGFISKSGYKLKSTVVNGNYLYASSENGLLVFDVSTPEAPEEIILSDNPEAAALNGPNDAQDDMIIYKNRLYAINWNEVDGSRGISVFDLENPADPGFVKFYKSPTYMRGIEIYDNHLYINTSGKQIHVYDLKSENTTDYTVIDLWVPDFEQRIFTSKFHKGYIYALASNQDGSADQSKYLTIAKLSSPVTCENITVYELDAQTTSNIPASSMEISGDTLYIGIPNGGDPIRGTLCAIDITIPDAFLTNSGMVHYYTHTWSDKEGVVVKETAILKAYGPYLFRADLNGHVAMYNMADPYNFDPVLGAKEQGGNSLRGLSAEPERKLVFVNTWDNIYIMDYESADESVTKYEAEFANLVNCEPKTNAGNFSGLGDVTGFSNDGSAYIEQKVYAPVAGTRTFSVTGAFPNQGGRDATVKLIVNSQEQKILRFKDTGTGWGHTDKAFTIDLGQGLNNVKFVPFQENGDAADFTTDGLLFIDYFEIGRAVTNELDLENQTFIALYDTELDGVTTQNDCTNTWTTGGTMTLSVNAAQEGLRDLSMLYRAGGDNWAFHFVLTVNGVSRNITFNSVKGSWTWSDNGIDENFKTQVYLNKGANTIVLEYQGRTGGDGDDFQIWKIYLDLAFNQTALEPVIIADSVLTGENGEKMTTLPASGFVNSSVEISTQTAGEEKDCMFVTVFYGEGNQLLNMKLTTGAFGEKTGTVKFSNYIKVPSGAVKYSVFLWENNMVPIKTFAPVE